MSVLMLQKLVTSWAQRAKRSLRVLEATGLSCLSEISEVWCHYITTLTIKLGLLEDLDLAYMYIMEWVDALACLLNVTTDAVWDPGGSKQCEVLGGKSLTNSSINAITAACLTQCKNDFTDGQFMSPFLQDSINPHHFSLITQHT